MTDPLDDDYQHWEDDVLNPALRKAPERRPHFETSSGIPLERLYRPSHADRAPSA